MALPPLEFTVFSATGYVRQHVGTLEELHAQGPMVRLSGNGTVLFRTPRAESILNLGLRVSLQGLTQGILASLFGGRAADGPLAVSVKGTWSHPAVAVNNIPL